MRKWIVTLAQPAVVHDVLRYPVEGSLNVSEAEAERLHTNKLLVGDPESVGEPDSEDDDGDDDEQEDDLDKLSVADLHLLVTKEGVALNDATKKADIVSAIRAHRASRKEA